MDYYLDRSNTNMLLLVRSKCENNPTNEAEGVSDEHHSQVTLEAKEGHRAFHFAVQVFRSDWPHCLCELRVSGMSPETTFEVLKLF